MSSICFIPGPRMLYATQPRTGTNAPKMMMRASRPAVCMSSVAASACSGMPRRPAAERWARHEAAATEELLHVLHLLHSGSEDVVRDPA